MASKDLNNEEQQDVRVNSGGVGALLKASRVRLGDDLRFVAETLHIRFIYLEAIEAGRYDELPGTAYAIGFIRSYADYLGLDSGEVVRRYKAESSGGSGATRLVFPVPIPESSIPGGAIIFVGVVVALLTYGVWYVSTAKDGFLAGLVSQVPERLSEQTQPEDPEFKIEPVAPEAPEATKATEATEANETPETLKALKTQEPTAEVVETQETTTPPEQVVAEIEKQVVETVSQPVEQATPEITSEVVETPAPVVAEVAAKVEEKVAEEQQPVVAEVAQKVEEVSQAVATEPDVSVSQPVSEPAPVATEEPPVAEPFVAEPATAPAPLQAVAEDPPVEEPEAAIPTSTQTASTNSSASTSSSTSTSTSASSSSSTSTTTSTPSNEVYGTENENSRILVKARKNSWIQVRDNNANRLLLTRLLRAGDSYRVPDQPGLVLLTGNAGALEILVDGEVVPDLGEAGKVRRNVTLDPDLLRQGAAAN